MDNFEQQAIARAKRVISICGGFDEVARLVGRSKSRVHSWTYAKSRHGTGGVIPVECQWRLLSYAQDADIALVPEDFFPEGLCQSAKHRGSEDAA